MSKPTSSTTAAASSQTTAAGAPATPRQANLILLGPPGAGKGTQAQAIAAHFGLHHLTTGELFRQHMQRRTPLGAQAKAYYDRGEYVPDDLVVAMVRGELAALEPERGLVLDGFPRTVAQAEALELTLRERGQRIDAAIELASDTEQIVRRAQGRRICPKGHTYHTVSNPPRADGRCDADGLPLRQRVDDRPQTVRRRIEMYHQETEPLLAFYRKRDLLRSVDGTRPIEKVTERIQAVLCTVGVH